MCVSDSVECRLLVVRVRNASDDDGVDRGLVSYEAEYFASDGIPRRPGTGAAASNNTSRYTQSHW
jgi:hypothetical protein